MNTQTVELNEGNRLVVESPFRDFSESVVIDNETTRLIHASAWGEMERHLVEANAAYNDTGAEPFERIQRLQDSLSQAYRYATVAFTLTAVPLDEDE